MSVANALVPPWTNPTIEGIVPLDTTQTINGDKTFNGIVQFQGGIANDPTDPTEMMTSNFIYPFGDNDVPCVSAINVINDAEHIFFEAPGFTPGFYGFRVNVNIDNATVPLATGWYGYYVVELLQSGAFNLYSETGGVFLSAGDSVTFSGVFNVESTQSTIRFVLVSNLAGNSNSTEYTFNSASYTLI